MSDLSRLYKARFSAAGIEKRNRVWRILCRFYFSRFVKTTDSVLDIACGYGEFINNVEADRKYAIDLNPDSPKYLGINVNFKHTQADRLGHLESDSLDVVFSSNFLEHLPTKLACDAVLTEIKRVLRPGGKIILIGPNIRYAYKEYWDFYDHYLPLSHASMAEGLCLNGYELEVVVDRFLPYTMNSGMPTADILIRAYLAMPFAWRFFGKQFLLVAVK